MLNRWFIPLLFIAVIAIAALSWRLWQNTHTPEESAEATVKVVRYTLQNGLELVVLPNDKVPAVTHMVWVKAGGADDPGHALGLAHYLEHLLFTGTEAYPEGEYDRMVAQYGGRHNAFTSQDYTAYYVTIAKERLEMVMALEADRFAKPQFTLPASLRERDVILEERKSRIDNRPASQLSEQMNALQFLSHPYGRPLIGWTQNIKRFDIDEARAFFRDYYQPANMVVVVAGDVDPDRVRKLAGQYYGAWVKAPVLPRNWLNEQPVSAERRVAMTHEAAKQTHLVRQITIPSLGTEKDAKISLAYRVFAHLAGGDATSKLYQALVKEQKLASSISAYAMVTRRGPGAFVIDAVPSPNVSAEALEAAIDDVLKAMVQTAPSDSELDRVKTQLSAQALYAQDGLEPMANIMGQLFMIGLDENYFYRWQENINAITASDVQQAGKSLLSTPAISGVVRPKPTKENDDNA